MHKSQFEGRRAGVSPYAAMALAMQRGAETRHQVSPSSPTVLKEIH